MSTEQNKKIARRFFEELWNKRNIDILDELDGRGEEVIPRARAFTRYMYSVWSNTKMTIVNQIAEGDWVATEWLFEATHQGEHLGVRPTGKRTETEGLALQRIADGKVVYSNTLWDDLRVLEQLGGPVPERPY